MRRSSSVAADLYRKDNKDRHDETIAIDKNTHLIAICLYILTKLLSYPPPRKPRRPLLRTNSLVSSWGMTETCYTPGVCTVRSFYVVCDGVSEQRLVTVPKQTARLYESENVVEKF